MKAKGMFKKLGYKYNYYKDIDGNEIISYWKNIDGENFEIEFNLTLKIFRVYWNHNITLKELQAINKQVEELGWKEED